MEIYACEINITILPSFLLAYLGYLFSENFISVIWDHFVSAMSLMRKHMTGFFLFLNAVFFPCLLTKKLNTFTLLGPILIFMLLIHYSCGFFFSV